MTETQTQQHLDHLPPPSSEEPQQEWLDARRKTIDEATITADRARTVREKMAHKDRFYRALGETVLTCVDYDPTEHPQDEQIDPESLVERVQPRSRIERFFDRRTEKKLDKLAQARYRNRQGHKKPPSQTFGVRPAVQEKLRLREAGKRYREGEITGFELDNEKLKIKASRGESAVRGRDQRINSRRAARSVVTTLAPSHRRPVLGAEKWRDYRSKRATRREQKALSRAAEAHAALQAMGANNRLFDEETGELL